MDAYTHTHIYIYIYNTAVLINICRFLINVVKLCKPLSKLDLPTIHTYTHTYTQTHTYIYIYIYSEKNIVLVLVPRVDSDNNRVETR